MNPVIAGFPNDVVSFHRPIHMTIGTYDGVHRGHQALLKTLIGGAKAAGAESMVVTFDPHPRCVLDPHNCPANLTVLDERIWLLKELGIDHIVVIEFTDEVAGLTPFAFMKRLTRGMPLRRVVIGENFRFGRGRRGDAVLLRRLGARQGFEVEVVRPVERGREPISSSRIRRLVLLGQMRAATQLLGRDYFIRSIVEHGAKRGRTLGFPTANLQVVRNKLIPPNAIYASRVDIDGQIHEGATSIGFRPTFAEKRLTVEVFLFDFDGDLYDKLITVWLVQRLRAEKRFVTVRALQLQMAQDVENARRVLSSAR